MKKPLLYSLVGVVLLSLLVLVISVWKQPKRLDERVTLRSADKIPYGSFAARQLLPTLFPAAAIQTDKEPPGEWKGVSLEDSNQALILIAPSILATEEELNTLVSFVQKGNYVFLITSLLNDRTEELFDVSSRLRSPEVDTTKRMQVALQPPRFAHQTYSYPGRGRSRYFSDWDSARTVVLGRTNGKANFLQVASMEGAFFLHYSPMAFSNYFILHKDNLSYYGQALSVLPPTVKKVVWNEFYTTRTQEPGSKEKEPNWLGVLFKYDAFKWGLLTAIATLALYMLLEMRRRQRYIPAIAPIKNESLDFVKTIGLLYYDKKDHHDLAQKMARQFLEHVRQQYKIPTERLDEEFIQTLQSKTGHPMRNVGELIGFIRYLGDADIISAEQLTDFYNNLENFYQTT